MDQNNKQQLIDKIAYAFADTPYPTGNNIGQFPPEASEIQTSFQGKHWRDISLGLIYQHRDKLPFLTTEAFRFYLPSFMIAVLLHGNELDTFALNLINSLAPPHLDENRWQTTTAERRFAHQVESFTNNEKEAILAFLDGYAELYLDEYNSIHNMILQSARIYWSNIVNP